jgi:CBS domain-containing protein
MIAAIVASNRGGVMHVREGMSDVVLTIGPGHSIRDAATAMSRRQVGAAVVIDPEAPGPGVITERDILHSIAVGQDPDEELVANHLTSNLTFASPDWSLEQAATAMVRGSFRHLIVVDGGALVGILSMRDIVRCWTQEGATSEVPAAARA